MNNNNTKKFLPLTMKEAAAKGWDCIDFVLVTGDAYVDHPSFGAAIIGRLLESKGYRVGIIAQPDVLSKTAFTVFGKPRLGFLVTSGNVDSMVVKYTSFKKVRNNDAYSPGGKPVVTRPDRALIAYTAAIRAAYSNVPVILGGLEASLRRFAHYDYWSNSVRRSILADSKADIIVYGMGERAIEEIAHQLKEGKDVKAIKDVRGTVYRTSKNPCAADDSAKTDGNETATQKAHNADVTWKTVILNSYEEICKDKKKFAENFSAVYRSSSTFKQAAIAEKTGSQYIIQNPPTAPLAQKELDAVYALPFTREAHPAYDKYGGVPALSEVKFSITNSRGCFGGCSFCAITYHQGKIVTGRSNESVIAEAQKIAAMKDFKGYIHDVGGPTANFREPACEKQKNGSACERKCLTPKPCKNLKVSHREYVLLLEKMRKIKGVKKVFIRSGIRFDYLMLDKDVAEKKAGNFFEVLCNHHISGQLRVAPEHISPNVLEIMGKPVVSVYENFKTRFKEENLKAGKNQFLIPYFISAHPGSGLNEAIELALYLKQQGFIPDQVQDFYPTPGTVSTCIYYTGFDPFTGKEIYSAVTEEEKKMQKALIHFNKPENYELVKKALKKAGRSGILRLLDN